MDLQVHEHIYQISLSSPMDEHEFVRVLEAVHADVSHVRLMGLRIWGGEEIRERGQRGG